ncbi:MAG: endonuclease/exonuclease/phosphatase family protein [Chloroflexota bacterium]
MTDGFVLSTEDHYLGARYRPLRVLTFNGQGGEGGDGRFGGRPRNYLALDHVADMIARLAPDIVALQEICVNCSEGEIADQVAYLAAGLGMYHAFAPVTDAAFLRSGQRRGRDFWGNAIISRYPITASRVHEYGTGRPHDSRSALETHLQIGDQSCAFFSTHLSYVWRTTFEQSKELAAIVAREECPIVLAGDFNAPAGSAELSPLHSVLTDSFTLTGVGFGNAARYSFPNGIARERDLDHIFVGGGIVVRDSRVIVDDTCASDHNPVLAEVLVPEAVALDRSIPETLADDMLA